MLNFSSQKILSVSELTAEIKGLLETEYKFVRVSGEISNLKVPFSGHSYFTLKDSNAQLRAVLFKQQKRFVELTLKDGQQVVCFGRISLYEPRGDYQLIVDSVDLHGTGQLQILFEQLRKKLIGQGYFDESTKKAIPFFPHRIAVVTSPTGAAVQDFLKIVQLRKCPVEVIVLPVKVQGKEAAAEIAAAVKTAEHILKPDVLVICRGGGSLEDLWAFNEEIVADAIYRCSIPVVTGIGHETDFTIADFCADHRCPTPTGAAEFLVPDGDVLRKNIDVLRQSLIATQLRRLDRHEKHLEHLVRFIGTLESTFSSLDYRLQLSLSYLMQAMNATLALKERQVEDQKHHLQRLQPLYKIRLQESFLERCVDQLKSQIQRHLEKNEHQLGVLASRLNGVSPLATLGRGYAVARRYLEGDGSYSVISDVDQVSDGERINLLLKRGQLNCTVDEKIKNHDQAPCGGAKGQE